MRDLYFFFLLSLWFVYALSLCGVSRSIVSVCVKFHLLLSTEYRFYFCVAVKGDWCVVDLLHIFSILFKLHTTPCFSKSFCCCPVCRTFPRSSKCWKDRGLGVKNACTLCHYKMVLHKGSRKLVAFGQRAKHALHTLLDDVYPRPAEHSEQPAYCFSVFARVLCMDYLF